MDDQTMIKEWDSFAKSINATVEKSKANYFDHDNYYKIRTDQARIDLIWSNQPQRGRGHYVTLESRLRFKLKNQVSTTLSVRPKDFLTKFSVKKQTFGVPELDRAYSFKSNTQGLIYELTELFKEFYEANRYNNFIIETETITDTPTLTIFIPELLSGKDKLAFYYNFGLKVSKIISAEY